MSEKLYQGVQPDRYLSYVKSNNIVERTSWNDMLEINNPIKEENWLTATEVEINSLKNMTYGS